MLKIEPKGTVVLGSSDDGTINAEAIRTVKGITLQPPVVEATDDNEDEGNGMELSKDIALKILEKLNVLLEAEGLCLADMKDITTMHKSVGDYYAKLGGGVKGSRAGLAGFITRMKR